VRVGTFSILVAAVLSLGGCEGDSVTGPRTFEGADEVREGLRLSRQVWAAKGPRDYEMHFRWLCFCPEEYVAWAVVTVENGEVTAARLVGDGTPVPVSDLDRYETVEGLFDVLQDGLDQAADFIRFEADDRLGYPRQAYIDYESGTADEELGFEVFQVTSLE